MDDQKEFSIEDFVERCEAKASTLDLYRQQLGLMERTLGKPLAEVSQRDLIDLKKKLREKRSGSNYIRVLKRFYKKAGRNDLAELCVIKQRQKRLAPGDILTVKEVQRLLDSANCLRNRAFLALLWDCGVRVSEAISLRLKDISYKENNGKKVFAIWFPTVKVDGEQHMGYLLETAPVMEKWLEVHPQKDNPNAPLYPGWSGKQIQRHAAYDIVASTAKRAEIAKKVYPHLFRHSRATYLLSHGMNESQVKKLLGWSASSNILARYSHLCSKDAYKALLVAEGYEPEVIEEDKLTFPAEELKPVVPMAVPSFVSGSSKEPEVIWDNSRVLTEEEMAAKIDAMTKEMERIKRMLAQLVPIEPGDLDLEVQLEPKKTQTTQ